LLGDQTNVVLAALISAPSKFNLGIFGLTPGGEQPNKAMRKREGHAKFAIKILCNVPIN